MGERQALKRESYPQWLVLGAHQLLESLLVSHLFFLLLTLPFIGCVCHPILPSLLGLDEVLLVLILGEVRVAAAVGGKPHDVLEGVAGYGVPGDVRVGLALLGEGHLTREEVAGEFDLCFGGCGVLILHTYSINDLRGKDNTKGRRPTTESPPLPHLYENDISYGPPWLGAPRR